MINSGVISITVTGILSSILTLILIYLSMALSKVTIRNKKIDGLWFIVFLIINSIASYISFKASTALPYYIDIMNFKVLGMRDINILQYANNGVTQMILFGDNYQAYLNVTGLVIQLLMSIGAFLTTGYLIEKRIDL